MTRTYTCAVVIATRHRAEPLNRCFASLSLQTRMPEEMVIVDSSSDTSTREIVEHWAPKLLFPSRYIHSRDASAARQRNNGVEAVGSDIVLFLDDDVVLEPDFVEQIMRVFEESPDPPPGGVSGTIVNQTYTELSLFNRLALAPASGRLWGSFAGKVIGPAINFLPADQPAQVQPVQWLPSTCTAYQRRVFLQHRFADTFSGYSFAEDLHLSLRVAEKYRLLNTTYARVFHEDLGKFTHKDWRALGESAVLNRHEILTRIMGRNSLWAHFQLFWSEVVYGSLAWLAAGRDSHRLRVLVDLLKGKLAAFRKIWWVRKQAVPNNS